MYKTAYCVRGFHEKACLCQQQTLRSSPGGSRKGACPLAGGAAHCGGVGGTHPPRLSPGGNGKGGFPFSSSLPQAMDPLCIFLSPSFRNRRLALLPFALWWGALGSRCLLVFSILKRVLPSQCRTERLSGERTRSTAHSQSPELGDLLPNETFRFRLLSFLLPCTPYYSAAARTLRP